MSTPKDIKTRKKYDPKERKLHVWATSIPVFVGEPRKKGPKSADLDQIFNRDGKKKEIQEQEDS